MTIRQANRHISCQTKVDLPQPANGCLLECEVTRVNSGGDECNTACEGSTNGAIVVHMPSRLHNEDLENGSLSR